MSFNATSFSRLILRPYDCTSTVPVTTQKPAASADSSVAAVYDGGDGDEHAGELD